MNKQYVLWNLSEARREITRMLREIESDPEYDFGRYVVDMAHLYHHINTAWNARDASDEAARLCSEADFERWRQFPSSEEIVL